MSKLESPLELIKLTPKWEESLITFLDELRKNGDDVFFSPHTNDKITISSLANVNKDLYYLLVEGNVVLGYGLLRGWDEGYQTPSLGLAIHPSVRGLGFGNLLINFLHLAALRRGCNKVRLRVLKTNNTAINMYKNHGYIFEEDAAQTNYLVGFKVFEGISLDI